MIPFKFAQLAAAPHRGGAFLELHRPLLSPRPTRKIPAIVEYQAVVSPILEKHCYECHGDGYDKGKVAFDALDTDEQLLKPDLWLRVLNNTRAGLMPAERSRDCSAEQQAKLERWIKYGVFKIDPHNPDPGRVTVRRLNRVEYRNTVQDLLGVDYNTDHEFPPDDTGFGFDNIGDALTMSPMLMEKYVAAAQTDRRRGRADRAAPAQRTGRERHGVRRPGRASQMGQAPARVQRAREHRRVVQDGTSRQLSREARNRGERQLHPGSGPGAHHLQESMARNSSTRNSAITTRRTTTSSPLTSGSRPSTSSPSSLQPTVPAEKKETIIDLFVQKVTIEGPLEKTHWVKTENYDRYFPRPVPDGAKQRHAYAKELLAAFAQKAYRRPLSPQDGDDTAERLANLAESYLPRTGQVVRTGRRACHGGRAVVAALPVQTRSACGPRAECAGRRGRRILACLAPLLFPVVDHAGRGAAGSGRHAVNCASNSPRR